MRMNGLRHEAQGACRLWREDETELGRLSGFQAQKARPGPASSLRSKKEEAFFSIKKNASCSLTANPAQAPELIAGPGLKMHRS
jgi:hypothetical protein